MDMTMEAPEVLTSRKRKLRERNTSRKNQQDSDPAHKQAEGGDLTSTCNLNNVSTVYLSDESNREASLSSDNSETILVNEGMETVNEALEAPSLRKRKARKRIKRKNNQHDSDPASKQAEESSMLSTCNLNNVSTVCLSDGSNKEAVFLSDNGETKHVNEGMETVKEALEVPSLRKRKARKKCKRKNKQQDSDPAHKQAEESGMLSTCNLNNVSTVCLSDGSNKEAVFLSDNGETKHVNEGMGVKEALEVPSFRKRKARKRSKRKNKQQDSDPAHKQAEDSGMLSTCNLNNDSTVCLSDGSNKEAVFLSDNGETKHMNEGMETVKEALEIPSLRKRKARKKSKRKNKQQDSDPAHKQAEESGILSTCNLNNVSTVCLSDERNREVALLLDSGKTKLVDEGMGTTKEAPEVPSLQKRKARGRNKRKNNQQDSDPAQKQAEESGMLSTCNLNNVSSTCLSDESNREAVFLSDNGETKLVNEGMETVKEALEVPSLRKRKARKKCKRKNKQQDSDPAHKQAEESGMLSTCNLNNVSTVCLSDGSNKEAVFLSDNGETKHVNEGMGVKEALEVPSFRKRKARKRSKRKNKQQDSDPAHKQAEDSGMLSTCNLNNDSTVCLSDGSNKEAVFLSDNGETKHMNEGMETVKEALEIPSLRKRKARKKSKRKNKQQDSDPAHKQAEESGILSTCNLNNVSTVCLSDERNREVALLLDSGKTKLVDEGMGTTKEAPEVPSLQKRKARGRNKRKNNQQDSDPAQKQAEESGMLSTCNLNNVSSTCLSDESNREAVFLSDNGETKLVNEGMETVKEALEVPSLRKRKARKKSKRKNKQQDSDPAHKQAEESGMLSTSNLNNVPIVCLSDERNKEVALLLVSGKTKLVNEGMGTTKEAPEVLSLQERKARRRNKRRNNQQDSDPAHKQVEEGGMLSTYNLNSMSTVCLSDETDREVFLSDKGETELVNKGPETTKEASEVPSLQNTKARRRNRRGNSSQDNETSSVSHAICGKENVPLESLSCLLEITPIPVRKKLLILDINGVLVDIVSSPPKGHIADIKIAKRAIFRRPFCFDFLNFCFERFEVGIWSSRTRKNVDSVVEFAMGDMQKKLLFCWDLSKCTATQFCTLENRHKPLVFKELRRIWEKDDSELPWEKGDYSESNTMLLDDSPYKALLNPAHTAIFPYPYQFQNRNDNSLGAGGDIRVYLEELAAADNVQDFVKHHPFGQRAISQGSPNWGFFLKVIRSVCPEKVTG